MALKRTKVLGLAAALGVIGALAWIPARTWSQEHPDARAKAATKGSARSPAPAGSAAPTASEPAVDRKAIEALEKMGAFLREQKAMSIRVVTETDEVLESGQKIQLGGVTTLQIRRPDRLRADVVSDRKQRQFFYDGKTLTLNGQRLGYYATVPAPPTLAQLADVLAQRYGLELPLADLFYWGTEKSGVDQIKSAIRVGPSRVEGTETDHYAYRQPDLDWQIWIERGPRPLPRKLVLTTTEEKTQPQHAALLTWDLAPKQTEDMFVFVPPKGSHRIELLEVASNQAPDTK